MQVKKQKNIWKIFIFIDFFVAKVDVTSVNFNSKKSVKMKFSADKIYYNFSQENSKATNM